MHGSPQKSSKMEARKYGLGQLAVWVSTAYPRPARSGTVLDDRCRLTVDVDG